MSLMLYAHPFSSYCWKVLIALWETQTEFTYRNVDDPAVAAEWQRLSPMKKMPILVDGDTVVIETSIIIEHLQLFHPGHVTLIPANAQKALDVRLLDRMSDNYLMDAMNGIVGDYMRPEKDRDPTGVAKAREKLDAGYAWWNAHMRGREWASDAFSLADCAAAPALFYADWVHPIPDALDALRTYRLRLLAHPSIGRAVEEARPYRHYFPPGAPDRD